MLRSQHSHNLYFEYLQDRVPCLRTDTHDIEVDGVRPVSDLIWFLKDVSEAFKVWYVVCSRHSASLFSAHFNGQDSQVAPSIYSILTYLMYDIMMFGINYHRYIILFIHTKYSRYGECYG